MTAILTITLSNEVLEALRENRELTFRIETAGEGSRRSRAPRKSDGPSTPRAGSLPARIIEWAEGRAKPFGTVEVSKKFKLSRAHASMLLSRLASGAYPITRERRGVYSYAK